eukprot:8916-Heterococcus_DN1.PRE.1
MSEPRAWVHIRTAEPLPKHIDEDKAQWVVTACIREGDAPLPDAPPDLTSVKRPPMTTPATAHGWNDVLSVSLEGTVAAAKLQDPRLILDVVDIDSSFVLGTAALSLLDVVPWNTYNLTVALPHGVQLLLSVCVQWETGGTQLQHVLTLRSRTLKLPPAWLASAPFVMCVTQCVARTEAEITKVVKALSSQPQPDALPLSECSVEAREDSCIVDVRVTHSRGRNAPGHQRPSVFAQVAAGTAIWTEPCSFALGPQIKEAYMKALPSYPDTLYQQKTGKHRAVKPDLVLALTFFAAKSAVGSISVVSGTAQAVITKPRYIGYAVVSLPDKLDGAVVAAKASLFEPNGTPTVGGDITVQLRVKADVQPVEVRSKPDTTTQRALRKAS